MLKQIRYKGGREKPFTVKCPSGGRYPVEPAECRVIEVEALDALHLLGSEPALWEPADISIPPQVLPADEVSLTKPAKGKKD